MDEYIGIYVGLDNTSDLGVIETEKGNFDWIADYIMEDIQANEENSLEELKEMKVRLENSLSLVSSKRFYKIVQLKEKN